MNIYASHCFSAILILLLFCHGSKAQNDTTVEETTESAEETEANTDLEESIPVPAPNFTWFAEETLDAEMEPGMVSNQNLAPPVPLKISSFDVSEWENEFGPLHLENKDPSSEAGTLAEKLREFGSSLENETRIESNFSMENVEQKLQNNETESQSTKSEGEESVNINVEIIQDHLARENSPEGEIICESPSVGTSCRHLYPKYYYSQKKKVCQRVTYYKCGTLEEASSFDTFEECHRRCQLGEPIKSDGEMPIPDDAHTLTFRGNGSLLYDDIGAVAVNSSIHVSFELRTYADEADIVLINRVPVYDESAFQIYFRLRRGMFEVQLLSNSTKEQFSLEVGGIQEGAWHSYQMWINPAKAEVILELNQDQKRFYSANMGNFGNALNAVQYKIFLGGIPDVEIIKLDRAVRQTFLKGCLRNLSIEIDNNHIAQNYTTIGEVIKDRKCSNRCPTTYPTDDTGASSCIDKFDEGLSNTRYENGQILTLSGHDFLSYALFTWNDRLHTFSDRFSFSFKTKLSDAILLHAKSENDHHDDELQFLTLSLTEKRGLVLEVNLGGETVSIERGTATELADNKWHSVDLIHENNKFSLILDTVEASVSLDSDIGKSFFHFDPYLFIGGLPNLNKDCNLQPDSGDQNGVDCNNNFVRHYYDVTEGGCRNFTYTGCEGNRNNFADPSSCLTECNRPGLRSYANFIGCMKDIFYNDENILNDLSTEDGRTKYLGKLRKIPIANECRQQTKISVNFPTESSNLKIQRNRTASYDFKLEIIYKRRSTSGVLASGYVKFLESNYQWELRVTPLEVTLIIPVDFVNLKCVLDSSEETWNKVSVVSNGQNVSLSTAKCETITALEAPISFDREINIGIGVTGEVPGFEGCISHIIWLDDQELNIRSMVGTSLATDDVIEDGCQMASPCEWVTNCGSSTDCSMENSQPLCNCYQSSFEGENCLIAKYRKSCLDYRFLGFNVSGNFIIDMDGEGHLPPTSVYCNFEENGITSTVVDHNIRENYVIRREGLESFRINVTYRDFDDEMLRHLIEKSSSCYQDVAISCIDAPLHLAKDAWFSSPWQQKIGSLGSDIEGSCLCREQGNCQDPSVFCNCNLKDGQIHEDAVTIRKKELLPITSLSIIQHESSMLLTSESKLQLGKLVCKNEEDSEQSMFLSSDTSYVSLPVWHKGDLVFRFRTTSNNGSIFYQGSSASTPSFKIKLKSENIIKFEYNFQGEKRSVLFISDDPINEGKWNLIWIDALSNQLRIVFNGQKKFMTLPEGQEISLFDGTAVFGNLLHKDSLQQHLPELGFKGCIQNLRMNNLIVDLQDLLKYSDHSEVSFGCLPSCTANPCKNGGTCIEKWESYTCICKNPFAHLGNNCETNLNENAVTFTTKNSEVVYFNSTVIQDKYNILTENFTFNFRTSQPQAILLVAKDYVQNLLQIYLKEISQVVLVFNHGKDLIECIVNAEDVAFNEEQSVQVVVNRFDSATTLTIFTGGQTFSSTVEFGVLLLNEKEYEQYPYEVLPHLIDYQHSLTLPGEYFLLFLGGVQSTGVTSTLSGLIGCFRGLKIGNKVIDITNNWNWNFGSDVEVGCTSLCDNEKAVCKNGGKCINGFQLDTVQRCNCLGTSYTGYSCMDEIAYNFNGYDAIGLTNWTLSYTDEIEIDFAFSSSTPAGKNQLILKVPIVNDRSNASGLISFIWSNESSLIISAYVGDEQYYSRSQFNGATSTRHHIRTFVKRDKFEFLVDKIVIEDHNDNHHDIYIDTADKLFSIGGFLENNESTDVDLDNFHGCISNIYVAAKDGEFWPLQEYNSGKEFIVEGLPKLGNCVSPSPMQRSGPNFYDFPQNSDWMYFEPMIEPLMAGQDSFVTGITEDSLSSIGPATTPVITRTTYIWPWIIVGCLIGSLILIGIICCLRHCRRKVNPRPDIEAHKVATQSTSLPPPYSLHPQRTESVPLLEREPSVLQSRPNTKENNETAKPPPWTQNVPEETIPLKLLSPIQTDRELPNNNQRSNESPQQLNSINRDSTSKNVPFKNQLSPDTNSLRHIDSSLGGSSDESFHDSLDDLDNEEKNHEEHKTRTDELTGQKEHQSSKKYAGPKEHPDTQVSTGSKEHLDQPKEFKDQLNVIDPELLIRKLSNLSSDDPVCSLDSEFVEPEDLYDKKIHVTRLNSMESTKTAPSLSSKINKIKNSDHKNSDVIKESEIYPVQVEVESTPTSSINPQEDDNLDHKIKLPKDNFVDIKKYYLKKKASIPPVLPPKNK